MRALLAVGLLAHGLLAQGTRADYERADTLAVRFRDKVSGVVRDAQWLDAARLWCRLDLGGGRYRYLLVDAAAAAPRALFDHERLAEDLAGLTGIRHPADQLPLSRVVVAADLSVRFAVEGAGFVLAVDGALRRTALPAEQGGTEGGRRGRGRPTEGRGRRRPTVALSERSPDGTWQMRVVERDVQLAAADGANPVRLTVDGSAMVAYESRAAWSPTSKHFVVMRTQQVEHRRIQLVESSPKDRLQPKLHELVYDKPGDPLPVRTPCLFDVDKRAAVPIVGELFATPWSIDSVRWAPDGKSFTFLYNQRGHQVLRVVAVDVATGAARALVEEVSATFVDYAHKTYLHWFDGRNQLLWMSERDGFNHLYLFDGSSGELVRRLTQGKWMVRQIDLLDAERRRVWLRVMGIHAEQDPYHVHHAHVDLDTGALTVLTDGDGSHEVDYSPDRSHYLATWSRVDHPPVVELRRSSDGKRLYEVARGDAAGLVQAGWRAPERFVAKGRDGQTDIWGVLYTPTVFDATRRYPVIEQIYAGPQDAFVPKTFAAFRGPQALAELGFVVVQIDGMGTNWRGKAFHDVAWHNLGDSGFPDRIVWLREAAKTRPWLDLTRVGIYGGSAGGQSALRALLAHGDFYKAGAADCGCHDNRMDKVWWNELWMGYPVGEHYAAQSNVTNAHKLQGKLLLTVGELDRNVDPASTMQVVNALIAADRDFELIVFPGAGHGIGESPYGQRRRRDFFVRALHGVEPRRE